ncbi:DUF4123 domain-containing protein [Pseudomonas anguilliseptica]|uniref:DUF4123 domain-containing protein n=1 Tax=Pseudomonas anguilliseptica TaxID=53406 RepID=UPI00325AE121
MTTRIQQGFPGVAGKTYLLLENGDEKLERVYALEQAPEPIYLFADTDLAAHQEQGPLLLCLSGSALLDEYRNAPNEWRGLLLSSPQPLEELLAHLRRMLIVSFDGNRKALLRYYDPRVASYFFPACDADSVTPWLGPIQQLIWHGGTWADSAQGLSHWHSLSNLNGTAVTEQPLLMPLNQQQTNALERQQLEHFTYEWLQGQSGMPFSLAWDYLQQGLAASFDEADALQAYLDLRTQYPDHATHPIPPAGDTQQRLQQLRAYLEVSPTLKESHA